MRVLVTGTRDNDGGDVLRKALEAIVAEVAKDDGIAGLSLIHGAAKGIDKAAEAIAIELGFDGIYRFPAEWDYFGSLQQQPGRNPAGMERNKEMLDTLRPDICLAFPGPKSKGTWGMVKLCERRGIEVELHPIR